jgi:ribosome-associated heat shock protein Hsp15
VTRQTDSANDNGMDRMRLDKWLWAARFFKTRQLAIDAINGGKVHLNGTRAKHGKDIRVGDQLTISKDQFTWDITVAALNSQRRPAAEAVLLYEESPDSLAKRQVLAAEFREARTLGTLQDNRPNKRERRLIHRFKRLDE